MTGQIDTEPAAGTVDKAAPATRAEVCAVACADLFAGAGEIIGSAFGTIPAIGVRLAKSTFAPDLLLSDGEASMVAGIGAVGAAPVGPVEAWVPFRTIFDLLWHGKRHVVMVPAQIDAYGNANISAIGPYAHPKAQLIGVRGAPGNSINHPTSYWVPKHSPRVFVPTVDMVSGVGNDRAAVAGSAARHHALGKVITDLAVLDYADDGRLRLCSVHPGVTVEQVRQATGFDLVVEDQVAASRLPTADELTLIRDVLDPRALRDREVAP